MYPAHCLECLNCLFLLGRNGQRQTVNQYILLWNAMLQRVFQNGLRHGKPCLCGLGNTGLIHGQTYDCRTIPLDNGQNRIQLVLFRIDGIDNCPAAAGTQTGFNRLWVRGINLQRQRNHALYRLDHLYHHFRFIYAGQANIDIQNIRTGLLLFNGTLHNIIEIPFPQGLLEPFLASGIDAFSDDTDTAEISHMTGRTHTPPALRPDILCCIRQLGQRCNKVRRGAAAAAQNGNPQLREFCHLTGKFRCIHIISAGCRVRKSRIRLDNQRLICPFAHFRNERINFRRSQGTVDAHGGNIQSIQCRCHAGNRGTGKGTPIGFKAHGDPHRQTAVLLCCQYRSFDLIQIGHGFKYHQIRTGSFSCPYHLGIHIIGICKGQGSQWFHQFSQRAHIQCYLCLSGCCLLRNGNIFRYQLLNSIAGSGKLMCIGAKGIGINHTASRIHIAALDTFQYLRVLYTENLRPLTQSQSCCLQHGTHSTIQ